MVPQKLFTRNFTLLLLGQISSLLGNYTLKFALSMYVLDKTGSASIFASLLAAALLPTILLSPLGGILADRADRRRSMVTLDVLSGASVAVAGLLLPLGQEIGVIAGLPLFGFMGLIFGPLLVSLFMLFMDMFRQEYLTDD